jgi:hypothetical protein
VILAFQNLTVCMEPFGAKFQAKVELGIERNSCEFSFFFFIDYLFKFLQFVQKDIW